MGCRRPGFFDKALTAIIAGENCTGWATQRPDWWSYIEDSILLEKHGSGAAEMFEMPTNSKIWRDAQRTLAYRWKQAEMFYASNTIKLG